MILVALLLSAATPPDKPVREGYEAETPLGTRLPRWDVPVSAEERDASVVLRRFAACVAKNQRPQAIQLVRTFPDSDQETAAIRAIVGKYSNCLQGASKMRLRAALFRGAIAEALYRAQIPAVETLEKQPMLLDEITLERHLRDADRDGTDAADANIHAIWRMSYCVAHEAPASVERLIRSDPATAAETQALAELRPVLGRCLFSNQHAEFNRLSLRAALAVALYRMRFAFGEQIGSVAGSESVVPRRERG